MERVFCAVVAWVKATTPIAAATRSSNRKRSLRSDQQYELKECVGRAVLDRVIVRNQSSCHTYTSFYWFCAPYPLKPSANFHSVSDDLESEMVTPSAVTVAIWYWTVSLCLVPPSDY